MASRRRAGWQGTRRLRLFLWMSASAWDEVRDAAREAGCVDFPPKPVRADVLFARLQRYTRVRFVSPIENGETALPPLTSIGPGDGAAARLTHS